MGFVGRPSAAAPGRVHSQPLKRDLRLPSTTCSSHVPLSWFSPPQRLPPRPGPRGEAPRRRPWDSSRFEPSAAPPGCEIPAGGVSSPQRRLTLRSVSLANSRAHVTASRCPPAVTALSGDTVSGGGSRSDAIALTSAPRARLVPRDLASACQSLQTPRCPRTPTAVGGRWTRRTSEASRHLPSPRRDRGGLRRGVTEVHRSASLRSCKPRSAAASTRPLRLRRV